MLVVLDPVGTTAIFAALSTETERQTKVFMLILAAYAVMMIRYGVLGIAASVLNK